jgi:glycosyltransferase involved in cell wall biosynthesis
LGEKLIVNPYGVDLTRFLPPGEPGRNTKPRILFVGSVGLRKGVPWLLQAFEGLSDVAELHLIGPVEKGFEKVLAQQNLAGVTLRGALSSDQLAAELQSADIFCLPSLEEGFPLSMLQAMASGLPVISTEAAGANDIIEQGIEGIIVPSNDAAALTEVLGQLVNNADLRRQMSIAARQRVEQGFSWDDYIERAITAYHALAATT